MLIHVLREDGFAYLEPIGGWGCIRTRVVIPQDAELTLNVQAPVERLLVQITDEAGTPYRGFSFADSVPITGDDVRCDRGGGTIGSRSSSTNRAAWS